MPERTLHVRALRFDPYDGERGSPRMQEYLVPERPRMTLFIALSSIREEIDPTLKFDFVCRAGVCGSCGLLVNGRPRLACRTRTEELPSTITLHPLPYFPMVGDLSVDTGSWFREMGRRVESWVHTSRPFNPQEEERMSNETAQAVYELDRCIECGCCLAGCATAQMREDFLGAAGLLRIARFLTDPRDQRADAQVFEVLGNDEGVFGCIGLFACQDVCPKKLPLAAQMAYLRRKMLLYSVRSARQHGNGKQSAAAG